MHAPCVMGEDYPRRVSEIEPWCTCGHCVHAHEGRTGACDICDCRLFLESVQTAQGNVHVVYRARLVRFARGGLCGYCGKPDADRMAAKFRWPGQKNPSSWDMVHTACELKEEDRAEVNLTAEQRDDALREWEAREREGYPSMLDQF